MRRLARRRLEQDDYGLCLVRFFVVAVLYIHFDGNPPERDPPRRRLQPRPCRAAAGALSSRCNKLHRDRTMKSKLDIALSHKGRILASYPHKGRILARQPLQGENPLATGNTGNGGNPEHRMPEEQQFLAKFLLLAKVLI